MSNYYCQQKCGFEDFDIHEHDALLKEVWAMPITNDEMEKIINGEPCKKQCFDCMAIVGKRRIETKNLLNPNQMNKLTLEQIIELAKKEIGYNRHLKLTDKKSADTVLYHWIEGYKYSLTQQKESYKKCFEAGRQSKDYPWEPKFNEWHHNFIRGKEKGF